MNWHKFFDEMPDFHLNRRKKHNLVDILVIALCALVGGAADFEKIQKIAGWDDEYLKAILLKIHPV